MTKLKELITSRKVWLTIASIVGAAIAAKSGTMSSDEALKLIMQNIGALVVAMGLVDAGKQVAK